MATKGRPKGRTEKALSKSAAGSERSEQTSEWRKTGEPGRRTEVAFFGMERVNGLEPSTYTLARYRSSQLSYTRTP